MVWVQFPASANCFNSDSSGSTALFWPLWASAHIYIPKHRDISIKLNEMQAPFAFWACKANFFTLEVFHFTRRGLIVCVF